VSAWPPSTTSSGLRKSLGIPTAVTRHVGPLARRMLTRRVLSPPRWPRAGARRPARRSLRSASRRPVLPQGHRTRLPKPRCAMLQAGPGPRYTRPCTATAERPDFPVHITGRIRPRDRDAGGGIGQPQPDIVPVVVERRSHPVSKPPSRNMLPGTGVVPGSTPFTTVRPCCRHRAGSLRRSNGISAVRSHSPQFLTCWSAACFAAASAAGTAVGSVMWRSAAAALASAR
jgi:hypothetical protein